MPLLCLGLSHHTANLALRERFTYAPAALSAALARFCCGQAVQPCALSELVILSTCNRTELYAVQNADASPDFAALSAFLSETRGIDAPALAATLYALSGSDVVTHLCRVAAGLDSMVLGEPQILGQVAEARQQALSHGAAGPLLSRLFLTAVRAGKRAQTETHIGRQSATLGAAAVRLAAQATPALANSHVLVLGAGAMAELAVEALRARGTGRLTVVNRTLARAAALAARWQAHADTFERLPECLAAADIVITSTDAPHYLVSADLAKTTMAQRPDRPLVVIDLAVPRDVDPAVAALDGVRYFDLDHLQTHLSTALAGRRQAVPQVEAIVAEETAAFEAWQQSLAVAPVLAALRARAEHIRQAELRKTLRNLPGLTPSEQQHVEALAEALVNKLLHAPTTRLRADAHYAAALRQLFALND